MSVSSKDVHEAIRVNNGGVAVSGGGPGALNEAGVLFGCLLSVNGSRCLLAMDKLAVGLERLVSVLNDETVEH